MPRTPDRTPASLRSEDRRPCRAQGALLATACALLLAGCGPPAPDGLLLVSLDTTRRDHLSAYGYARETSPALAGLARGAVVFERAFAQETNTNPSHASMFTGLYPHEHGSLDNLHVLDPAALTLAEILARAGFACGGFVSGYTLSERYGLGQGFAVYDADFGGRDRRPAAETTERALAWLDGVRGTRFFLFVHFFDAHGPYRTPEGYEDLFGEQDPGPALRSVPRYQRRVDARGRPIRTLGPYARTYDASIRFMDDQLARLLDAVDLDRTVVVVIADHGETLSERYWTLDHGASVFDEQIRIPLVVHAPGRGAASVDAPVETVDLLPTLLELLAVAGPDPWAVSGRVLPGLIDRDPPPRATVFASSRTAQARHADRGYALDESRRILTARDARWKLIVYPGVDGTYQELYDLASDPGEERDVAERFPSQRRALQARLDAWLSGARPARERDVTGEERERLRSLGYVD
jgi:arylsulfatase